MEQQIVLESIQRGNVDELIHLRGELRKSKQWKPADDIRDFLETKLVFVFDAQWGQQAFYLTSSYFKFKDKFDHTREMSNRKYVEYRIAEDSRHERIFDGWLQSTINAKA
ncbi:MAG: hypothetical protein B7Z54_02405 [Sphingobacteriales bacterium 12-47-4]|nr:MAG: hypothetical protein B7Z54_02405 [Sphingobacteriales bacterium 12-47-4]